MVGRAEGDEVLFGTKEADIYGDELGFLCLTIDVDLTDGANLGSLTVIYICVLDRVDVEVAVDHGHSLAFPCPRASGVKIF